MSIFLVWSAWSKGNKNATGTGFELGQDLTQFMDFRFLNLKLEVRE